MFEVGWTEMLVIAIVMIVVVGPKDLPNMLRTFGRTTAKLRAMAADFQKQFNEALKEAELDDVKKSVDELRGLSPVAEIKKQLNPFEQAAADVRAGVDAAMKPKPAPDPATPAPSTPVAAEPLKNGATTMPGGAEVAPATFPAMTDESVAAPSSSAAPKAPAAKRATKAAPVKAGPVAKASAAKASAPAKAKTAPAPKPEAAKPAEAKTIAAKTIAAKTAAKAEPKLAPVKKPAAKKDGGSRQVSVSDKEKDEIEKSSAPLMEHLIELRRRLIWSLGGFFVAFLVCFFFAKRLFNLLVVPFKWATKWAGLDPHKVELIYTAPQEFFFTQVKLAMFGGMVIAFPLIATQIYKFIAPGLYKNERNAFLPFLIASPILFLMGASLVYFFFTPMVMWFFLAMQQAGTDDQVQISLLPKVSEYLSLIMTLIFSFGLVFQLPVVTSLMTRVGMLSSKALAEKRKWAIVIAFIVAAVLTPPDPMSQIGLAIPTILLYEVSIWAARWIERDQEKQRVAREKQEAGETVADKAPDEPPAPAAS